MLTRGGHVPLVPPPPWFRCLWLVFVTEIFHLWVQWEGPQLGVWDTVIGIWLLPVGMVMCDWPGCRMHDEVAFSDLSVALCWQERLARWVTWLIYSARSLNPAMEAFRKRSTSIRIMWVYLHCLFSEVILYWLWYWTVSVVWSWEVSASGRLKISSMVKSIGGKWAVLCTEVVHFSEGPLLEVLFCTYKNVVLSCSFGPP